jgi:predicted XRE-type DNA-binding protein
MGSIVVLQRILQSSSDVSNGTAHQINRQRFVDLDLPVDEVPVPTMRAELTAQLRLAIQHKRWARDEAATRLLISQRQLNKLVRGECDKFSLAMLLTLAARAGLQPRLTLRCIA